MSERPNEQRAFPYSGRLSNGEEIFPDSNGMSLRDYFAGQALAALADWEVTDSVNPPGEIALYCYEIADAMMKAREK